MSCPLVTQLTSAGARELMGRGQASTHDGKGHGGATRRLGWRQDAVNSLRETPSLARSDCLVRRQVALAVARKWLWPVRTG